MHTVTPVDMSWQSQQPAMQVYGVMHSTAMLLTYQTAKSTSCLLGYLLVALVCFCSSSLLIYTRACLVHLPAAAGRLASPARRRRRGSSASCLPACSAAVVVLSTQSAACLLALLLWWCYLLNQLPACTPLQGMCRTKPEREEVPHQHVACLRVLLLL
jgi:hypothetical protein